MQIKQSTNEPLRRISEHFGLSEEGVVQSALYLLNIAVLEHKQGNKIVVAKNGIILRDIVGIFDTAFEVTENIVSAATTESKESQ